jgi:hypothetical protein
MARDRKPGDALTGLRSPQSADSGPERLDPAALAPAELARILAVPEAKVRGHIAAGAPTGPDGTVNLVHYVAWINRELAAGDGD